MKSFLPVALLVGSDAIRAWRYHIGGNRPLRFSSGLGTGNGRITVALDPFGRTVSTSPRILTGEKFEKLLIEDSSFGKPF